MKTQQILRCYSVGDLASQFRRLDPEASVQIRGAGSNPDPFADSDPDVLVDTTGLQEIHFSPDDFTVTVGAGVQLESLADEVASAQQCLRLEPPTRGTVGSALATGAHGPSIFRYGSARDQVIGMTVVLTDGSVAHSGGKVIKNVAGYDLARLFVGSRGRIGVIAGVVLRTYPIPETKVVVEVAFPPKLSPLGLLRNVGVMPTGIEALRGRWYIVLEGSGAGVQGALSSLEHGSFGSIRTLGEVEEVQLQNECRQLRTPEQGGALCRIYCRPRDSWPLYQDFGRLLGPNRVTSHLGSGLIDLRIPGDLDAGGMEKLRRIGDDCGATLAWRAGNAHWIQLITQERDSDWEAKLKAKLDPQGHLRRGNLQRDSN